MRKRSLLRGTILVAWVAVMVALALRSRPPPPIPAPAPDPVPAETSEEWQGIYAQGSKIGYSHRLRSPSSDGFTVRAETSMALRLMGDSQVVRTRLNADTDRSLRPRRFDFRLSSGTTNFAVSGTIRAETLELVSPAFGRQTIPLAGDAPLTLSETLQDSLGAQSLESGKTIRYAMFDPLSGASVPVSLTVGALERVTLPSGTRSAYRVEENLRGARIRLWVEPGGRIVKEEGPLGLTVVRETDRDAALRGIEGAAGVDLASTAAIPVARAIRSPRTASRLRLHIAEAASPSALSFPPRQTLTGESLSIERESAAEFRSFVLPATAERFADDLRATPFLQVADPTVQGRTRSILGSERDAERAARALLDWVYHHLAKVPTLSVPNAVQVLAEGKGDCNEHSVLYAALARAAGLPARIATGAVYMPGGPGATGAFYYHAWDEIWLGEWVAVDPTFGQFPADATHVKLAEGGPDQDVALFGVLGRLRFEVEDVS